MEIWLLYSYPLFPLCAESSSLLSNDYSEISGIPDNSVARRVSRGRGAGGIEFPRLTLTLRQTAMLAVMNISAATNHVREPAIHVRGLEK
jgi:hypothetical protein